MCTVKFDQRPFDFHNLGAWHSVVFSIYITENFLKIFSIKYKALSCAGLVLHVESGVRKVVVNKIFKSY